MRDTGQVSRGGIVLTQDPYRCYSTGMFSDTDISSRLKRVREGDRGAAAELFPLVHAELHRLARKHMADQRASHTLQPTALVNEAYLKLVQNDRQDLADRPHFFRLAASPVFRPSMRRWRLLICPPSCASQRQGSGALRLLQGSEIPAEQRPLHVHVVSKRIP